MPGAMKDVLAHLQGALRKVGMDHPSKLIVAASGGLDSTVLLHVLHALGTTSLSPMSTTAPEGRRTTGTARLWPHGPLNTGAPSKS